MARIGLVLFGGMAKEIYQIGVLKAIEEFIEQRNIICISAACLETFTDLKSLLIKNIARYRSAIPHVSSLLLAGGFLAG